GHPAILGVDAEDYCIWKKPRHPRQPVGVLQRLGADDDAADAPAKSLVDMFLGAQAAAKLARDAAGLHNRANARTINGSAFFGAVEIDDMKKLRPFAHPAPGHGRRVGPEHGFLAVIALAKPDALAAAQVD